MIPRLRTAEYVKEKLVRGFVHQRLEPSKEESAPLSVDMIVGKLLKGVEAPEDVRKFEVSFVEAKKLSEKNALTFEHFFKLIERYVKNQESSFAVTAFEELFKEPLTPTILPAQKIRLYNVVQGAQQQTRRGDVGFGNWNTLLTRVRFEV